MAALVYQYGTPVPPFGCVDADEVGTFPIYEGADPVNLGAHEGLGLLLKAEVFDPGYVEETPGPLPFGCIEDGDWRFSTAGSRQPLYIAATHGRSTTPTDVPPNRYIPGKFTGEISNTQSLFEGADPTKPGQASIGELRVVDPDGELESLLGLGWDGADITLLRGDPSAPFSTFQTVGRPTASGMIADLRTKLLRMRDQSWLLQTAELHGQRYGGTGGLDGDASWTGRLRPYAVGWVFNVTPVMINAILLIGQVSCSSVTSIPAVYDGRIALTPGADYASYAALAAATVAPGTFATCLAEGLFRLGSKPFLGVTCDVVGDADVVGGTPGPTSRGRIVRRIATALGAVRFSDSEQIDFRSFQEFERQQPAPCGWYWDGAQPVTKAEAITEVLAGVCGWWLVRPNGQLAIGQVEDPTAGSPMLVLSWPGGDTLECRLGEPSITDVLQPRRATYVGWQRNYTVQTPEQIADAVAQADVTLYGQPSLYALAGNNWIANSYPSSTTVTCLANYRDELDATIEANRQAALFSVLRRRYAIPAAIDPLADIVSQRASLRSLNRLGWGEAKPLLCCGIESNTSVTLHFWG